MSALGASGASVLGTLLVEAPCVAVLGGLAGALVARGLLVTMLASAPANMQMLSAAVIGLDWRAFAFAAGLAARDLSARRRAAGAAPRPSRPRRRDQGPRAGRRRRRRASAGIVCMVVTQLALVAEAADHLGPAARSFARLVSVSPGFEVDGRVVAEIQFPAERYARPGDRCR